MSDSTNRGIKYVSLGLLVALLLALVVLLLALLYTSYNFSMSLPKATATMEAVVAKAELALAVAQTSEAKVGTQADAMKTPIARAETAVAAVEMALAAAETAAATPIAVAVATPTTTPNLAPTGPMITLNYGVSITYQAADSYAKVLYSVDNWMAYQKYEVFLEDWEDRLDSPATVQFALIETQDGSKEWQLFYAQPISDTEVTLTEWSEYVLSAKLAGTEQGSTAGEPTLAVDELVFDEREEQKIVASTRFTVTARTTSDSLVSLREAVGDAGANRRLASRLLLADDSAGKEPNYTLIILRLPGVPAEGDVPQHWCCRYCEWDSCYLYSCCR